MVTDYSKEFHLGEKHGFEVYYSRWAFKVDTRPCVNGLENMIRRLLEFFGMLGIPPKNFKFDGDDNCCGKGSVYGFSFKVFLSDNEEDYILELWKTAGNYGYRYPVASNPPKED